MLYKQLLNKLKADLALVKRAQVHLETKEAHLDQDQDHLAKMKLLC